MREFLSGVLLCVALLSGVDFLCGIAVSSSSSSDDGIDSFAAVGDCFGFFAGEAGVLDDGDLEVEGDLVVEGDLEVEGDALVVAGDGLDVEGDLVVAGDDLVVTGDGLEAEGDLEVEGEDIGLDCFGLASSPPSSSDDSTTVTFAFFFIFLGCTSCSSCSSSSSTSDFDLLLVIGDFDLLLSSLFPPFPFVDFSDGGVCLLDSLGLGACFFLHTLLFLAIILLSILLQLTLDLLLWFRYEVIIVVTGWL